MRVMEDKPGSRPLVSVIMIFLNEKSFLQEAIESVLGQSYQQWELFLVDDGSKDGSAEIARRFAAKYPDKVQYLEHEGHANRGMSASRNLGLRCSKGEFIAFLDGDDVWLSNKLQEQVTIMLAHPSAAMVYGRTQVWHSWTGRPKDKSRDHFYTLGVRPDQLVQPPRLLIQLLENRAQTPTTCNVMVRRSTFDKIGQFEESFRTVHEDQVFYTKVHSQLPTYVANACWTKYRQHPKSSSAQAKRKGLRHGARLRYLKWAKQYLLEQGVGDPEVWKMLEAQLRHYDRPLLVTVGERLRNVGSAATKRLRSVAGTTFPAPLRARLNSLRGKKSAANSRVLILMYHRVIELDADPYGLCVSPDHFEDHLQVLHRTATPLSLSELVRKLRGGQLPERGVVVTFDDGYLDNLQVAKPLLEKHEVPATVFVTSGAVPMRREFWWDELDRLLLRPGRLPGTFSFSWSGSVRIWQLGAGSLYSENESHNRVWNVHQAPESLAPRQRFFQEIQRFTYELTTVEKHALLDQLAAWSGADASVRTDRGTLTPAELGELARGPLIEIGAHTVSHPSLRALLLDEQYMEMHESKSRLEEIVGRPVSGIAFPHGEYTPDTLIGVSEAGFEFACTVRAEPVGKDTDRQQLPRFKVEDWDAEQFVRKLDTWFRQE